MPLKLSLSEDPNPQLVENIGKYGGKLGGLYSIAQVYQKYQSEFDATGISLGMNTMPLIVPPGSAFTTEHNQELIDRFGEGSLEKGFLVRGSLPGDYRSLIDVIPTRTIHPESVDTISSIGESINQIISNITLSLNSPAQRKGIGNYAKLMQVPFQKGTINFGIVPKVSIHQQSWWF